MVGADVHHPCEALLAFSFSEAARKGTPLRFLHSWTLPASYGYAAIVDPGIGEELGSHFLGGWTTCWNRGGSATRAWT